MRLPEVQRSVQSAEGVADDVGVGGQAVGGADVAGGGAVNIRRLTLQVPGRHGVTLVGTCLCRWTMRKARQFVPCLVAVHRRSSYGHDEPRL